VWSLQKNYKRRRVGSAYNIPIPPQLDLPISYNIAPSQNALVIRFSPKSDVSQGSLYHRIRFIYEDSPMSPEERKAELEDPRHELLLDQLRNDIRTEVARDLHRFRARESEFSAINPGDLLAIYLNWKHRQVHPIRERFCTRLSYPKGYEQMMSYMSG
jgi:hypothetical protein